MSNALILAAGLGTRLRPLTDTIPKALVPVCGRPLLEHQIERLRHAGFDHIVVNVHHFADQIIDFLHAHDNFGLDITVSDERDELLDTGGAIKRAGALFPDNGPVLVHNVDILHNVDLATFHQAALDDEADATLLVSQRVTTRYLHFDSALRLCGWENTKTGQQRGQAGAYQWAFAGIHMLRSNLISAMADAPDRFSIIDFYLGHCATHTLRAHFDPALRLLDVGKIDTLAAAEQFLSAPQQSVSHPSTSSLQQ